MIIGGGKISKETLLELFDYEQKAANLDYAYKRFYSLTTLGNVNLSAAESEQKSGLYRILKDNVDFLTIQPVLEYFFNKVDEIERVRRVLVAIKAGYDKESIKDIIKNV